MLLGTPITSEGARKLLDQVFLVSDAAVYTSDSEFGQLTQRFQSSDECFEYLQMRLNGRKSFVGFAVHYPEAHGYVGDRRVTLDPVKCREHTFRYSVGGWGVIHVQFHLGPESRIGCDVTVNSEKRARAWFPTYPEFREPDLWNWKLVARYARKLQRSLKAMAQQAHARDVRNARA